MAKSARMIESTRSFTMRAVKSRDTKPEMIVRRLLYSMGYRYRLHRKDLPGNPDIVFPGSRKIIQVHGCFWHGHACKRGNRSPKTNTEYWSRKIARNIERDASTEAALHDLGWDVLTVWECQTATVSHIALADRLKAFLTIP
jgi:DNA mismatch endonuclease, patch repair protein